MSHYDYQDHFKKLYDKAVRLFREGNQNKDTYFEEDEKRFIAANGWRTQDFFDYAEDWNDDREPSYEIAQSIEQVRREYFLHMQNSAPTEKRISIDSLPPKKEELDGISWLPRIIAKARGKLLGELPDEIMYCCGGDRAFLQKHDLHPAEFLRVIWANLDDDKAVLELVKQRSPVGVAG